MKKVGIVIFHRADNYGAVLQNYSICAKYLSPYSFVKIHINIAM